MADANETKSRPASVVILSDNDDQDGDDDESKKPTMRRTQSRLPRTPPSQRRPRRQEDSRARIDVEMIDLTTPHPSPNGLSQAVSYVPRTLQEYNQQRLAILPAFIMMVEQVHVSNLLLANVPPQRLSPIELSRREPNKHPWTFKMNPMVSTTASIMMKEYEKYFGSILPRLQVDVSILDYNYTRLNAFLKLFREARMRILPRDKCLAEQTSLDDHELPMLLEFYLQMDVDLFYMKTGSFNEDQGLFLTKPPKCHYAVTPCNHCNLCRRSSSTMVFNRYDRHRFVNGYESILNAPATCQTTNVIYVITCHCEQVDYISETKYPLLKRLQDHRSFGQQMIRRALIGSKNIEILERIEALPTLMFGNKISMLLYQHFIQCSTAIQRFLEAYPNYWCFVPIPTDEATEKDRTYSQKTTVDPVSRDTIIDTYLMNIPKPPDGYRFTQEQVSKQIDFFKLKEFQEPMQDRVELFQTEIIAVLPPNSSDLFRQILHSLFVTHTEAKLNTLGHVFDYMINRSTPPNATVWCASLRSY